MATDVQVPALGESITEGTLAQWLKKPGEQVAEDEPIASLETDKVTVEVPSPTSGVLTEQLVKEGDTVAVGALIARIDDAGADVAAAPAKAAAAEATNPPGAGETPALRGDGPREHLESRVGRVLEGLARQLRTQLHRDSEDGRFRIAIPLVA